MKICVVPFWQHRTKLPSCDVALVGVEWLGTVDYTKEISGESDRLERVVKTSSDNACGVVAGCRTKSRSLMRLSAAVAEGGRLCGVCDMNHVFEGQPYAAGNGLGVYRFDGLTVGVCVGNDCFIPSCMQALASCGCQLLCVLFEDRLPDMAPVVLRSYAYLFGVPVAACGGKTAVFAEATGELAVGTDEIVLFETDGRSPCRLLTSRVRGCREE